MQPFSADYLRSRLHYDPETGIFIWKERAISCRNDRTWNTRYSGKVAGSFDADGYFVINVGGKVRKAHRLAWLYVYGEVPPEEIDHQDRNRRNNKIANLRKASDAENSRNASIRQDNTSGMRGVSWHNRQQQWQAQINIAGKRKSLGYFSERERAAEAYAAAVKQHFGEFTGAL